MNSGESLEDLTPIEVIRVMRKASGLTLEEIAVALGRTTQTVGCWFSATAVEKFIPVSLVPDFCHVVRSPLLIEWLRAQYERLDAGLDVVPADPARALGLVLRAIGQASAAAELLHDQPVASQQSFARQCAASMLLAVASLVAAVRSVSGNAEGPRVSFFRGGESLPPVEPFWRRLARRARQWWRREAPEPAATASPEGPEDECAWLRRELGMTRCVMGAMGYLLRRVRQYLDADDRMIVDRLLRDAADHGARTDDADGPTQ